MIKQEPKILIYDIETTLLALWGFSLGKTVLRHNQLLKGYWSRTHVICITYRWAHEKKAKILTWGDNIKDEQAMFKEFDEIAKQADVVIGKNSNRFDNKHINTQRLWFGLEGRPDWIRYTDDLEVHMRKNFYLASNALDYLSEQLGLGGKDSMQFSDWTDINIYRFIQITECEDNQVLQFLFNLKSAEIKRNGKVALKKMYTYGMKDADDTLALWNYCKEHFEPKFNMATYYSDQVCKQCGSADIHKNGTRLQGQTIYQSFHCKAHGGYAGRASVSAKTGKLGKIS